MTTKIEKFKKSVRDNAVPLAFTAGVLTMTASVMIINRNITLLKLTKDQAELLKQGGAVVYELKDQTLHLINLPVVEATIQAAQ